MIELSEILQFLNNQNIPYNLVGDAANVDATSLQFASTKHKIPNGCYYATQDYVGEVADVTNSVIITNAKKEVLQKGSNLYILVEKPQLVHYKLAATKAAAPKKGIHPTALVSLNAKVSPTAYIGPYCILEDCEIKDGVQLLNNVIIRDKVSIGEQTVIEGNSVIGARGMAWIWGEDGERVIQPQMGGVIIGAHCIIGTDISIVRGSLTENTIIGDGTIIAHGTKIGHGSRIDKHVHMANNVSLAGNAHIGTRTFLGSACVISSNVSIAANCIVGAGAVVNKSNDIEFATLVGVPAKILNIDNFSRKPKGAPKPFKNK